MRLTRSAKRDSVTMSPSSYSSGGFRSPPQNNRSGGTSAKISQMLMKKRKRKVGSESSNLGCASNCCCNSKCSANIRNKDPSSVQTRDRRTNFHCNSCIFGSTDGYQSNCVNGEVTDYISNKILYGIPVFLSLVLYLNTIPAGFVYDDHRAVVNNPDVIGTSSWTSVWGHDFWGASLQRKGSHGSWRPLTTLSFRLNALLQGTNHVKSSEELSLLKTAHYSLALNSSWHFHATNVALHGIVTWSYVTVLNLVGIPKIVCLWAGSLFAAHPVHVEAVGGIVGRAELLAAIAFCSALGAYIFYLRGKKNHIYQKFSFSSSSSRLLPQMINFPNKKFSSISAGSYSCLNTRYDHLNNNNENSKTKCNKIISNASSSKRFLFNSCSSSSLTYLENAFQSQFWLFISVGVTWIGIMCKEQAITALGVAIVLHSVLIVSKEKSTIKKLLRAIVEELWISFLLTGILLWWRMNLFSSLPSFAVADNPAAHSTSLLTKVLSVGRYWVLHARLLLFPDVLSFDWSMGAVPLVSSIADIQVLPVVVLIFTLGAVIIKTTKDLITNKNRINQLNYFEFTNFDNDQGNQSSAYYDDLNNNRNSDTLHSSEAVCEDDLECPKEAYWALYPQPIHVAFALALLIVPFLPASNIMAWVGFVAAERVLYLPSMGSSLLLAFGAQSVTVGLADFIHRRPKLISTNYKKIKRRTIRKRLVKIVHVFWICLVVVMGARTVKRNADWYSDETLYRSGITVCPAKALANLGVVYSDQGRDKEAEMAYRSALEHAPNMADTHYNLGLLLMKLNRPEEAVGAFKEALRSRPWLAQAHLSLSTTVMQLGNTKESIEILEECVKHHNAPAKDGMGHIWAIMNCRQRLARLKIQNDEALLAIDDLQKAISSCPMGYPRHSLMTLLAEALVSVGDLAEAKDVLNRALKEYPGDVPAHIAFSRLLQANGSRTEDAEYWIRRAVALAPNDAHAHKHLGQLLLEQGRVEASIEPWLRASTLDPQDHTAIFNSATALRLAGKTQHAEQFYKKAVQIQPQDLSSQRNLGAILHLNGKLEEALHHYNLALDLSPGDPQTTTNMKRLKALLNKKGIR